MQRKKGKASSNISLQRPTPSRQHGEAVAFEPVSLQTSYGRWFSVRLQDENGVSYPSSYWLGPICVRCPKSYWNMYSASQQLVSVTDWLDSYQNSVSQAKLAAGFNLYLPSNWSCLQLRTFSYVVILTLYRLKTQLCLK